MVRQYRLEYTASRANGPDSCLAAILLATERVDLTFDPSGVSSLGLSPDGKTLLVEDLDPDHQQSLLFPLTAPALTAAGSRTVLASMLARWSRAA